MIIDDDPDFIEVTKLILEQVGFEVISASQAQTGFEMAQVEKPDLLIMDLVLESQDAGVKLAYRFRGDPHFQGLPIIILTAARSPFGEKSAKGHLPVDELMEKPLSPQDLIETVRRLLA